MKLFKTKDLEYYCLANTRKEAVKLFLQEKIDVTLMNIETVSPIGSFSPIVVINTPIKVKKDTVITLLTKPDSWSSRLGIDGLNKIKLPYDVKVKDFQIHFDTFGYIYIDIKDQNGYGWDLQSLLDTPTTEQSNFYLYEHPTKQYSYLITNTKMNPDTHGFPVTTSNIETLEEFVGDLIVNCNYPSNVLFWDKSMKNE